MPRRRKVGMCPCGAKKPYRMCCGRFIDGDEVPETAELLMRSRYSAYAHGDVDYVIETTDPDGPRWEEDRAAWEASIEEFSTSCAFDGVSIHETSTDGDRATVRFTAKLSRGKHDASFSETSSFVRREGRWYYHSGQVAT